MENIDSNIMPNNRKGRKVEDIYQKKTQLEHILLRPDTYVGTIEKVTQPMWVLDEDTKTIVSREITYVPGLFKIFDEIMVNAADNKQRDASMSKIKVTIDQQKGSISVWNNGRGIPIEMHKKEKVYVPELIFGHLLTGSNFNDNEKKTTGGRNGYGAKLANIFSKKFIVETGDSASGYRFKQVFRNNMQEREEPAITDLDCEDFTCITFFPDLGRFKMESLDDDIVSLLSKRVYDMAGCISTTATTASTTARAAGGRVVACKVSLNGKSIPVKSFQDYMGLYDGLDAPIAFEKISDRWTVGIGVSEGKFTQISFVNSICTTKGGTHVNYIADQVVQKLVGVIKRKNKGEEVKGHHIKNHLCVFVNCLIENPAFDSQTKDTLTVVASKFGSSCSVPDKMLKLVEKSEVVNRVLSWTKFQQTQQLKRKGGSKRSKLVGITKLDDANYAGTAKARDCTLIITEGDSAKALAISGLSVVGRDYYGVFPLKGKPLNVREASHKQIMGNEEIQNVAQILGLKFGQEYTDVLSLRYGHLMIMADQDTDGSHIKGLVINFIHHFWPSLLRLDGFLQEFITPIVKCTSSKGRSAKEEVFFTLPEYHGWRDRIANGGVGAALASALGDRRESTGGTPVKNGPRGELIGTPGTPGAVAAAAANRLSKWSIKYYKGLGTSTSKEAKEYFSNLATHQLPFSWKDDERDGDLIEMAFSKKRVEDRKDWLRAFVPGSFVDYGVEEMQYDEFINKELIQFSMADLTRSIPNIMDGLKPAQRKVLFSCFKRNLKNEIKVAQLAGYVSEHSAYHHGEMSLTQTIINMAQTFVGSNNVNMLVPSGQFGTRLMGGKDHASPRYVFTCLEKICRCVFHPSDDPLLDYLDDDGQSIEPTYYVPVIPLVLVNGADGIGTGWSTSVPNYNPRDLIAWLRCRLSGDEGGYPALHPWYKDYNGEIRPKTENDFSTYVSSGHFEIVDDSSGLTVHISELPLKKWTQDYKQFLEASLSGGSGNGDKGSSDGFVKDFKENHTDTRVSFTVNLVPEKVGDLLESGGLKKKLKLESSLSTTNMHLFNSSSQITKYATPESIVEEFFGIRLDYYHRRKAHMLDVLNGDLLKLENKVRFIKAVIEGELIVTNRPKEALLRELFGENYLLLEAETKAVKHSKAAAAAAAASSESSSGDDNSSGDDDEEELGSGAAHVSTAKLSKGYDYLLSMKIWSLTLEKVEALMRDLEEKRSEHQALKETDPEALWLRDLEELENALDDFDASRAADEAVEASARRKAQKNVGNKKRGPNKNKAASKKQGAAARKKAGKYDSDDDIFSGFLSDDSSVDSDYSEKAKRPKPAPKRKPAPRKAAPTTTATSTSSSSSSSSSAAASTANATLVDNFDLSSSDPAKTVEPVEAKKAAPKRKPLSTIEDAFAKAKATKTAKKAPAAKPSTVPKKPATMSRQGKKATKKKSKNDEWDSDATSDGEEAISSASEPDDGSDEDEYIPLAERMAKRKENAGKKASAPARAKKAASEDIMDDELEPSADSSQASSAKSSSASQGSTTSSVSEGQTGGPAKKKTVAKGGTKKAEPASKAKKAMAGKSAAGAKVGAAKKAPKAKDVFAFDDDEDEDFTASDYAAEEEGGDGDSGDDDLFVVARGAGAKKKAKIATTFGAKKKPAALASRGVVQSSPKRAQKRAVKPKTKASSKTIDLDDSDDDEFSPNEGLSPVAKKPRSTAAKAQTKKNNTTKTTSAASKKKGRITKKAVESDSSEDDSFGQSDGEDDFGEEEEDSAPIPTKQKPVRAARAKKAVVYKDETSDEEDFEDGDESEEASIDESDYDD